MIEQPLFTPQPTSVTGEFAVLADDAVTGDNNGQTVIAIGFGNRAYGFRLTQDLGLLLVGTYGSIGYGLQSLPHLLLENRAGQSQRHCKGLPFAGKIIGKFVSQLL